MNVRVPIDLAPRIQDLAIKAGNFKRSPGLTGGGEVVVWHGPGMAWRRRTNLVER